MQPSVACAAAGGQMDAPGMRRAAGTRSAQAEEEDVVDDDDGSNERLERMLREVKSLQRSIQEDPLRQQLVHTSEVSEMLNRINLGNASLSLGCIPEADGAISETDGTPQLTGGRDDVLSPSSAAVLKEEIDAMEVSQKEMTARQLAAHARLNNAFTERTDGLITRHQGIEEFLQAELQPAREAADRAEMLYSQLVPELTSAEAVFRSTQRQKDAWAYELQALRYEQPTLRNEMLNAHRMAEESDKAHDAAKQRLASINCEAEQLQDLLASTQSRSDLGVSQSQSAARDLSRLARELQQVRALGREEIKKSEVDSEWEASMLDKGIMAVEEEKSAQCRDEAATLEALRRTGVLLNEVVTNRLEEASTAAEGRSAALIALKKELIVTRRRGIRGNKEVIDEAQRCEQRAEAQCAALTRHLAEVRGREQNEQRRLRREIEVAHRLLIGCEERRDCLQAKSGSSVCELRELREDFVLQGRETEAAASEAAALTREVKTFGFKLQAAESRNARLAIAMQLEAELRRCESDAEAQTGIMAAREAADDIRCEDLESQIRFINMALKATKGKFKGRSKTACSESVTKSQSELRSLDGTAAWHNSQCHGSKPNKSIVALRTEAEELEKFVGMANEQRVRCTALEQRQKAEIEACRKRLNEIDSEHQALKCHNEQRPRFK